jgi:carbon starvation protein
MSLPLLAAIVIVGLSLGYRFYGRFIARQYSLDDSATTPAERLNDGVDFVPTRPFYLLGQHFSAIAAAGPIAGPILACQLFGWLPCVLWIGLGVIFIGAVHDFSALVASVRHQGRSVAEIVREQMGPRAWLAMMVFIWLALIYVIVAFADLTASTFVGKSEELESLRQGGGTFTFNPGGAVAAASTLYLVLAVAMGLVERHLRPPLWLTTIVFVPATLGVVWLGTEISTWLILPQKAWALGILGYCIVASLLPVWMLLQPRGYLGGFVLYLALAIGVLGIFFGGFEVKQEAFKGWTAPGPTGSLFPFLFVTIACGACSGFHGLVCSGTTSKQIALESHCRPVGYGGMLLEGLVAVIALATIMIVAPGESAKLPPGVVYGNGLAHFLTALIGPEHFVFAMTFGAMAFSTFVFDTLDLSTRLGRYIVQELFDWRGRGAALGATLATIVPPALLALVSGEGAYRVLWTLFGTSNQLLAALTLLGLTVWLRRSGKRSWFTAVPMVFVMTMTVWSLVLQIGQALAASTAGGAIGIAALNGIVALVLLALALALLVEAARATRVSAANP